MAPSSDLDKLRTFIQALDLHLALGKPPARAVAEAVEDYAFTYHNDDGRHPIERKKERAVERKIAQAEGKGKDGD